MTWLVEIWQESLHLVMDQWIQYKLGKQYFLKESYITQGSSPIQGDILTTKLAIVSVNNGKQSCEIKQKKCVRFFNFETGIHGIANTVLAWLVH